MKANSGIRIDLREMTKLKRLAISVTMIVLSVLSVMLFLLLLVSMPSEQKECSFNPCLRGEKNEIINHNIMLSNGI